MPPKAKFTKEAIIDAGLAVLRRKGLAAVTAREIGRCLGSSSRPIFTVFENMGGISAIEERARDIYSEYVQRGLQQKLAFKGVGQAYIAFAINEPLLFRLLFMKKLPEGMELGKILPEIKENDSSIVKSITDQYPVADEEAVILYRHLWVYFHGIATLCATAMCRFTEQEAGDMLTAGFKALLFERLECKEKR